MSDTAQLRRMGDIIDHLSEIASFAKAAELAANGFFYSSGQGSNAETEAVIVVITLVADKIAKLLERLEAEMRQAARDGRDIDERDSAKSERGKRRAARRPHLPEYTEGGNRD